MWSNQTFSEAAAQFYIDSAPTLTFPRYIKRVNPIRAVYPSQSPTDKALSEFYTSDRGDLAAGSEYRAFVDGYSQDTVFETVVVKDGWAISVKARFTQPLDTTLEKRHKEEQQCYLRFLDMCRQVIEKYQTHDSDKYAYKIPKNHEFYRQGGRDSEFTINQ